MYSFTLITIDFQLANIHTGIRNADKTTKSMEIPSIPNLYEIPAAENKLTSSMKWKPLVLGKFDHKNNDKINTTKEVHNATILVFFIMVFSSPSIKLIKKAPKIGIKIINDKIGQLLIFTLIQNRQETAN